MSIKNKEGLKKVAKMSVTILGLLLGIFIVYKLFVNLVPFIIAFVISILIEPLISFFMKKLKVSRAVASIISVFLVLCIIGFIIVVIVSRLIVEIVNLSASLPKYFSDFYKNMDELIRKGTDIYLGLPLEVTQYIESATANLSNHLMKAVNAFLTAILNTAVSIPGLIVFILITILGTYFFSSDKKKIYGFFESRLPGNITKGIQDIKDNMLFALIGYIKAQLILMSITFTELYTGFLIIGVKHSLLLALLTSFVDALPILGVGSVLIPWSVYSFLTGSIKTGFSTLIIYVIVLVVRQTIEPKILSYQIGMHPLLTLLAMYTGLQFFGVLGLILGPITVLLSKNIISGILKNRTLKEFLSDSKRKPGNVQ